MAGKFNYILTLLLGIGSLSLATCQAPIHDRETNETEEFNIVELDRLQWSIGDLKAETVFLYIDGQPTHQTTVRNSSDRNIWWPGLRTGRTGSSFRPARKDSEPDEEGEEFLGGFGMGSVAIIGCYAGSSSEFNPERNDSYLMEPGAKRNYEKNMEKVKEGFVFSGWNFSGETDYPCLEPLTDYPPFGTALRIDWDENEGCSVTGEDRKNTLSEILPSKNP